RLVRTTSASGYCCYSTRIQRGRLDRIMEVYGFTLVESDGHRVVRIGYGPGICAVIRLLVHGLSGGPARDGCQVDVGRATHATHCRNTKDVLSMPRDPAVYDRDSLNIQLRRHPLHSKTT